MTPPHSLPSAPGSSFNVEDLIYEAELALAGTTWTPPSIGELAPQLPDYEILRFVERGGMGAVYEARQKRLQRRVALKILPMELGGDAERAGRFMQEATLAANLLHPNIVTVYDSGTTPDGQLYYAMEYVSGGTLADVAAKAPLPAQEAIRWLSPVAAALACAHSQGVVHHDLKPANILVGQDGHVKVADFGLAQVVTLEGSDGSEGLGSADYSAPEQSLGGVSSHPRADLYSLAVIARELLTRAPLSDEREPSALVSGLDERFNAPLLRAMRRRPEERHASVVEFWDEMEAALAGAERDARARLALKRSRRFALVFGVLSLVALAGMLVAVHQTRAVQERERIISQREASARRETAENSQRVAQFYVEKSAGHYRKGLAHLARAMRVDPDYPYPAALAASLLLTRDWPVPVGPAMKHGATITSAVYDRSGERILTTSLDGTAQLWKAADGSSLGEPMRHSGAVNFGRFSPDGGTVATVSDDRTARLWDGLTGRPVGQIMNCPGRVVSMDLSGDGKRLATLSATTGQGGEARLWSAVTGEPLCAPIVHSGVVREVKFSHDGRFFATSQRTGEAGAAVQLFDAATGAPVPEFSLPPGEEPVVDKDGRVVRETVPMKDCPVLAFGEESLVLAVTERDFLRILEIPSGRILQSMRATEVSACRFLKRDTLVAVGGESGRVRVLDWAARGVEMDPVKHDQRVTCLDVSRDRQLLISGSQENMARIGHLRPGRESPVSIMHAAKVTDVRIHPSEYRALTASADRTARQWLFVQMSPLIGEIVHGRRVDDFSVSRDGLSVVAGGRDTPTVAYDLARRTPSGPPLPVSDARTVDCGGGDDVLLCTGAGRVVLCRWKSAEIVRDLAGAGLPKARCARFSPDGRCALIGREDGSVSVVDVTTGVVRTPLNHAAGVPVRVIRFDASGRWLATGSDDGLVRVWNWQSQLPEGSTLLHDGPVNDAAFSPDGTILASCGDDNTTRFCRLGSSTAPGDPIRGTSPAKAVAFTRHGDGVTIGDGEGHIRLRHVTLSFPYSMAMGGVSEIRHLVWVGETLLAATADGTIRFWEPGPDPVSDPAPRWWPSFCEEVAGVRIDPDGRQRWGSQDPLGVVRSLTPEERASPYGRIAERWLQARPLSR